MSRLCFDVQTWVVSGARPSFYFASLILAALAFACSDGDPEPNRTATSSATASVSAPSLPEGSVTFYGADPGDQAGAVVAGDFNGDAATDVAISASLADGPDGGRTDAGEVYMFLGPFAAGSVLDGGAKDQDATFFGAAAGNNLGRALAAGDFNGDSIDDLAMAAPSAADGAGAIYVMFGGNLPSIGDFALGSPDVLITGAAPEDFAGIALSSGDLDGDGRAELAIGGLLADGPDGTRIDAGAVYVLSGGDMSPGEAIQVTAAQLILHGASSGDHLGESMAIGDFNGDGLPDLIAVATFSASNDGATPGAGRTNVVLSPATGVIDLATQTGIPHVDGEDEGDQLGHSIGVGDTNADGADDLWLGAVSADGPDNSQDLAGEAVLVLGEPGSGRLSAAGRVYGPALEARLGRSAASGDLDGDGKAELMIAAPNVASRAGAVYVFRGGDELPSSSNDATRTIPGMDSGDILGHESLGVPALHVALSGGSPILLISAPGGDGPDNNREDCGEVYLVPGEALFD